MNKLISFFWIFFSLTIFSLIYLQYANGKNVNTLEPIINFYVAAIAPIIGVMLGLAQRLPAHDTSNDLNNQLMRKVFRGIMLFSFSFVYASLLISILLLETLISLPLQKIVTEWSGFIAAFQGFLLAIHISYAKV